MIFWFNSLTNLIKKFFQFFYYGSLFLKSPGVTQQSHQYHKLQLSNILFMCTHSRRHRPNGLALLQHKYGFNYPTLFPTNNNNHNDMQMASESVIWLINRPVDPMFGFCEPYLLSDG